MRVQIASLLPTISTTERDIMQTFHCSTGIDEWFEIDSLTFSDKTIHTTAGGIIDLSVTQIRFLVSALRAVLEEDTYSVSIALDHESNVVFTHSGPDASVWVQIDGEVFLVGDGERLLEALEN